MLGQGGMGQVYEAEHIHIDKRVAVKLLRREVVVAADPDNITLLPAGGARGVEQLGHPAIIAIEDFAPLPDGSVYLAMELLRGRVARRLPAGQHAPLPSPRRCASSSRPRAGSRPCTQGRHRASRHQAGEPLPVHAARRAPPQLKILDFGIAKVTQEGPSNLHADGRGGRHASLYVAGTSARPRHVDARSDIYALGIIAYQLLAGDRAVSRGSLLGVLNQHVQVTTPRPLREVAPGARLARGSRGAGRARAR